MSGRTASLAADSQSGLPPSVQEHEEAVMVLQAIDGPSWWVGLLCHFQQLVREIYENLYPCTFFCAAAVYRCWAIPCWRPAEIALASQLVAGSASYCYSFENWTWKILLSHQSYWLH